MDNAGKVNDIGLHKSNIRAQYWKQLRIWESEAKIGNTGWAQGADTHDVHLADTGLLPDEGGRGQRRCRGAEGVALDGSSNYKDEPSPEGNWVDIEKIVSWVRNIFVLLPKQSKSISHLKRQTRGIYIQSTLAKWYCGCLALLLNFSIMHLV